MMSLAEELISNYLQLYGRSDRVSVQWNSPPVKWLGWNSLLRSPVSVSNLKDRVQDVDNSLGEDSEVLVRFLSIYWYLRFWCCMHSWNENNYWIILQNFRLERVTKAQKRMYSISFIHLKANYDRTDVQKNPVFRQKFFRCRVTLSREFYAFGSYFCYLSPQIFSFKCDLRQIFSTSGILIIENIRNIKKEIQNQIPILWRKACISNKSKHDMSNQISTKAIIPWKFANICLACTQDLWY